MKKIVIEELISQTFEVADDVTDEDVEEMYINADLVLDSPDIIEVNVQMAEDESWIKIY